MTFLSLEMDIFFRIASNIILHCHLQEMLLIIFNKFEINTWYRFNTVHYTYYSLITYLKLLQCKGVIYAYDIDLRYWYLCIEINVIIMV